MQSISELERSVSERLSAAAGELEPDPDALDAVRGRATARRRRRRRSTVAVVSAAATLAVVAAVAVWSTGDPRAEVTAGPGGEAATHVTEPGGSVPSEPADATLVIYRYPNATAKMIAEDPKMGGEWAVLNTAERSYHANGPLSELGAKSTPGVTVTETDGVVSIVIESPAGLPSQEVFTYEAATGRPLDFTYPTEPASDVEYVSVTRVRVGLRAGLPEGRSHGIPDARLDR